MATATYRTNFCANYCEGKIFCPRRQRKIYCDATTSNAPTANIMCEKLPTKNCLPLSPPAVPPKNAQGKDYFQCIWLHGVLATNYFAENYASVAAQTRKKLPPCKKLLHQTIHKALNNVCWQLTTTPRNDVI